MEENNFHPGWYHRLAWMALHVDREYEGSSEQVQSDCPKRADLRLLGGDEVQTLVKFVNLPSPHPGSFLKAPMPLPWGEGGRRPGEGSVADEAVVLGGLRLLLTYTLQDFRRRIQAG